MAGFDRPAAASYDQWYDSKLGNFVDIVETDLAFGLLKANAGMNVLDVGCGTGNFSIKLARMGCHVTGIDVSEEMLAAGRRKAAREGLDIKFLNMDACRLAFRDGIFDAVLSMAALEFIKDPAGAVGEMFRVAKKGGRILVGTINRDSRWGELYSGEEYRRNSVFKYASFKTLPELKRLGGGNPATGQCLFIPPDIKEDDICMEKEQQLSGSERGGFICALWSGVRQS